MIRFLVAFLALNASAVYLANAKTVVLIDTETGFSANGAKYSDVQRQSEDSDVINFCRMCKSYVDLYQQADDTVEIRLPLEGLCEDVEENDQYLCLESIDNLHRLATFDDLSAVENFAVCQMVGLCEELSSSEEEESANGSDLVEDSEQQMRSDEGIVENLLVDATDKHAHLMNASKPGGAANHHDTPHGAGKAHAHPVATHPHPSKAHDDHGGHPALPSPDAHPHPTKAHDEHGHHPAHLPPDAHAPIHPDGLHINHAEHHPEHPPHGHTHGHTHGHNNHKHHHSGASGVVSSVVLLCISFLISKNW